LDTYSAHRSAEVREMARLWGIDLVFIPPGCTDQLQPLDRRVFGVLKAYARQIWRTRYHGTGAQKVIKPMVTRGTASQLALLILRGAFIYLNWMRIKRERKLKQTIANSDTLYRLTIDATSQTRTKISWQRLFLITIFRISVHVDG
jgi:hypothetical protein